MPGPAWSVPGLAVVAPAHSLGTTATYTGLYSTTVSWGRLALPSYTWPNRNSGPMYVPPSTCSLATSADSELAISAEPDLDTANIECCPTALTVHDVWLLRAVRDPERHGGDGDGEVHLKVIARPLELEVHLGANSEISRELGELRFGTRMRQLTHLEHIVDLQQAAHAHQRRRHDG